MAFHRSKIKYICKQYLPRWIYSGVMIMWHYCFIWIISLIEIIRLRSFTHTKLVTLSHREKTFSLYISPSNGFIDKYIYQYGVYEPFIFDILHEHLHPGMSYLDIGANIGQHAMYACSLVGQKGNVYAFEPIPNLYTQLHNSMMYNHFEKILHPYNIALGDRTTKEVINVSNNIGGSSIVAKEKNSYPLTIEIARGDDILSRITSLHCIKIDVEGFELEVLTGLENTINKYHPILIIEFSGELYLQRNNNIAERILNFLRKNNYAIFDIEELMKEIKDDSAFIRLFPNNKKQTNLFCKYRIQS